MDRIISFFDNNFSYEISINLIISVLALFVVFFINRVLIRIIYKYMENIQRFYYIKKVINYSSITIVLIILSIIWFSGIQSMSTFLGLISAGIAIALKDLIINLVGWVFILIKRPFEVGDRIEINGCAGDVIDQRIFQFSLMEIGNWVEGDQSTGRIIHIPNSKVFTENLANFTKTFKYIWNEISITITFDSDWKKAKSLLFSIVNENEIDNVEDARTRLKEASLKYMMMYKNLTPIVYTDIKEYGVKLTIRYLCEPRRRRSSKHNIYEKILVALNEEPNIELAYPTQKIIYENR